MLDHFRDYFVSKKYLKEARPLRELVPKLAEEHGASRNAIYRWLSQDASPFFKKRRSPRRNSPSPSALLGPPLCYRSKLKKKDWDLKIRIENVLHEHPA